MTSSNLGFWPLTNKCDKLPNYHTESVKNVDIQIFWKGFLHYEKFWRKSIPNLGSLSNIQSWEKGKVANLLSYCTINAV